MTNANFTRLSVTASAAQNPPIPQITDNSLIVQGGISIAVILAIRLLIKALAELIKATHD